MLACQRSFVDEFLEQAELCPAVATIMQGQRNAAIPSRTGAFAAYLADAALAMFEGTANPISTVGKLLVGVDLDQGDVRLLVTADQLGRVPAVVLKDERHLVGVGDDMVVGYNVAGGGRATAAKGSGRNRYSRPRRAGPRSIPAEMPRKPLPRIPPCHYLPGTSVDWSCGDARSRTAPSRRRLESSPCDSSVLSLRA